MVDYHSIPDWLAVLVAQKPRFNMKLTEYEENLVKSHPNAKLPEDLQKLLDTNPEEFKNKCLLTSYSGVDNYRENYYVRKLFMNAYKLRIFPEFGSTNDENDFISSRRWYCFSKFSYISASLGAIAMLNVAYVFPRYSAMGLLFAGAVNLSLASTLYILKEPVLHSSKMKARIAQYRAAEKYREILLNYHKEHRIIYQYNPRAQFPPNPLNQQEKAYEEAKILYNSMKDDPSDLERHQKNRLLRYKYQKSDK